MLLKMPCIPAFPSGAMYGISLREITAMNFENKRRRRVPDVAVDYELIIKNGSFLRNFVFLIMPCNPRISIRGYVWDFPTGNIGNRF